MKRLYLVFLLLSLIACFKTDNALGQTTYRTVNDGNFNTPSTWDCNCIPPINANHTLIIEHNVTRATNLAPTGSTHIIVNSGGTLTINGAFSQAYSSSRITVNNGGTLAANSISIDGGVGDPAVTFNGTVNVSGNITSNGGRAINIGSTATINLGPTAPYTGDFISNGSANISINGTINGRDLLVSNSANFSGTPTLNLRNMGFGTSPNPTWPGSPFTGWLSYGGNTNFTGGSINLSGSLGTTGSGSLTIGASLTVGGSIYLGGGNGLTFNGPSTVAGNLIKEGGSPITINNSLTVAGNTDITGGGAVTVTGNGNFSTGNMYVVGDNVVTVNGNMNVTNSLNLGVTSGGSLQGSASIVGSGNVGWGNFATNNSGSTYIGCVGHTSSSLRYNGYTGSGDPYPAPPGNPLNLTTCSACPTISITNKTATTCSGTAFTVSPSDAPAGTTYSWAAPSMTAGITGGTAASGQSNISQTLNNSGASSGTATYTVTPSVGSCTGTPFTVTVTVNPLNTIAAGTNRTVCINSAMTNISLATTSATGATFTGLPAGVTGSWAGDVATISGTPTASGTFNYTVTTTGGCPPATATGTITVNPLNTIEPGTDQTVCINSAITDISLATTSATGATFTGLPAGVTGSWAGDVATISGTPTASGTFNYTVTTTGGCPPATATGTITVNPLPTASVASTNVTCNGANDGTITITPISGTPTYQFQINGGGYTSTSNFTNLAPTTYTLSIMDGNGCVTNLAMVTITEPDDITATITPTPASCNGVANGEIDITGVSGGSGTYEYSIDGTTWTGTTTFTGLTDGPYTVSIRDAAAPTCIRTFNTTITVPDPIAATVTPTPATCNGVANGEINITGVSGGSGTYEYSIDGTTWSGTTTYTGLAANGYTVSIRDAADNACVLTVNTTITQPDPIAATVTPTPATCNGVANGEIDITGVSGGSGAYEYSI
ncbi:MAG: beta strand repeat-containing protein, partial [Cytophagaceae bacterium]